MRKYAFTFMALAAMFGLSSCNKELAPAENINENNKASVIYASTEDGSTKTALDGYSVVWSTGDAFILDGKKFTLKDGAGTTNGTFTGTLPTTDETYDAWYGTDGTTLPTVQTYKAGAITNSPMHASVEVTGGEAGTISFKNLCGLLKLSLKGTATIRAITISANESISGAFKVTSDAAEITGSCKEITLNCGSGVTLNESTATDFYIALPENTDGYTGVSITLTDTEGKTHTKTFKGTTEKPGLVIKRSSITTASFTTGEFLCIINGHLCVELAGYYWATENVYNAAGATAGHIGDSSYGSYYIQSEAIKAAESWGGTWTLPSGAQWQALLDNCTWAWTTDYEFGGTTMNGYLVTDKTDASKFIFLPAGGFSWNGENPVNKTSWGQYWSSTVNNSQPVQNKGTLLSFEGGDPFVKKDQNELTGFPVRPVAATLKPTRGTAEAIINGSVVNVPWVQLWKDGPKFATYNVGVIDGKAESFGGYYTWGGTNNNATEWKLDNQNPENGNLSLEDDTAYKLWGSNWRMPTADELGKYSGYNTLCGGLLYECTWKKTEQNGVNGLLCTGKGAYSSNSIFLPDAGKYDDGDLSDVGSWGAYFSSSSYYYDSDYDDAEDGYYVNALNFDNEDYGYIYVSEGIKLPDEPTYSFSVRAVLNEE